MGATVLIATLFTAEKWNQPRCPSADTWIKKVGFYSTVVKKNSTHWKRDGNGNYAVQLIRLSKT